MAEIVTSIKAVSGSFQWVIEDWSSMPPVVNSADVECAGHRWRLRIYPRGREEEFAGHVSLYLHYCGREQGVSTSYTLRIVSQLDGKADFVVSVARKRSFGFIHTGDVVNNRGFPTFISQARLAMSPGLLVGNTVVIRAELAVQADEPTHAVRAALAAGPREPAASLARDLLSGLEGGEGAGVVLVVEDQRLPAHKEILALRSPVFKAMFSHGTREAGGDEVLILDLSAPAVRELLRFMYADACSEGALATMGEQLLAAADKYQVEGLLQLTEMELASSLSVHNVADRLALAELHRAETLRDGCVEFVVGRAAEVLATEGWRRLASNGSNVGLVNEVLATAVCAQGSRKRLAPPSEDEAAGAGFAPAQSAGAGSPRWPHARRLVRGDRVAG